MNYFLGKFKLSYLLIVTVAVAGSAYFVFKGEEDLGFDFAPVEVIDLERIINVTGRVESSKEVNLAFENSGKISSVFVDVGDKVSSGKTLVSQVSDGISADLAQARARLKSAESKLEELKRGSRPEEIAVQKIKVSNADLAYQESRQALVDEIKSSYTKADDAVRNKVDQFISNPTSDNPKVKIQVNNVQYKINVESGRILMNSIINNWKSSVNNLSITSDLEEKSQEAKNNILKVSLFLDDVSIMVNSLESSTNLSQTTIDGYKSDIFTARSNMDTTSTNLSTDIEGFRTSLASLNLAKEELILMEAGSDPQAILAQEANVEEAEANVLKFQSELNKRFISTPISGLVTYIDVLPGEIVSANEVVVSLISDSELEITANIPETDIVEIAVGNDVSVTLDAYDDSVVFQAKVIKIDPAETIIEGVPIYKTTFAFVNPDERIRSGMTADIDILVLRKEGVLAVPRRSVFEEGGKEFVRIWNGMEIMEREVETGFVGTGGMIEIISGITQGENTITFIRDEEILDGR